MPGARPRNGRRNVRFLGAPPKSQWKSAASLWRIHQWSKNLLVFFPAVAGHQIGKWEVFADLAGVFCALSLAASSGYIINDLHDLEADRKDESRRTRPLASGEVGIAQGLFQALLLITSSAAIASWFSAATAAAVLAYWAASLSYSWYFRGTYLLDVFVLVSLYMIRLVIGHEIVGIAYSYWFMTFFGFLLMSLALLKRYGQVRREALVAGASSRDRPYGEYDFALLAWFGVGGGIGAVIILAFYLNSGLVKILYGEPYFLAAWFPLLIFLLVRTWRSAHNGTMHDDPVKHLMCDPAAWACVGAGAAAFVLAL